MKWIVECIKHKEPEPAYAGPGAAFVVDAETEQEARTIAVERVRLLFQCSAEVIKAYPYCDGALIKHEGTD